MCVLPVKKSCEHKSKVFFTFVDLKKAYDSVSREAMWLALNKLGVPHRFVESFHEETKVKIRLDGVEEINVHNGLRQGCCMAPVLYTCLVIERWLARVDGVVQCKYDQQLFRRYTRNAMISWLTECLFADDDALLASTRSGAKTAMSVYQQNFGLTVSLPKHMVTGRAVEVGDQALNNSTGPEICIVCSVV